MMMNLCVCVRERNWSQVKIREASGSSDNSGLWCYHLGWSGDCQKTTHDCHVTPTDAQTTTTCDQEGLPPQALIWLSLPLKHPHTDPLLIFQSVLEQSRGREGGIFFFKYLGHFTNNFAQFQMATADYFKVQGFSSTTGLEERSTWNTAWAFHLRRHTLERPIQQVTDISYSIKNPISKIICPDDFSVEKRFLQTHIQPLNYMVSKARVRENWVKKK